MSDHKTGDVQGHREEMPAQEGAPVQEKAPAQEAIPTREKVPALEEISTWEVAPAREVAPSQEGAPTREEAHKAAPRVSGRQRVVLAVLALCFVALIAVCGFALATDGGAPAPGGVAVQLRMMQRLPRTLPPKAMSRRPRRAARTIRLHRMLRIDRMTLLVRVRRAKAHPTAETVTLPIARHRMEDQAGRARERASRRPLPSRCRSIQARQTVR